jgi:tetratricopeptide (TPR) repeat protein
MDLLTNFPRMAATLGATCLLSGRFADAVPLLTQAMEQAIATEIVYIQAHCGLSLGEAHLLTGRLEDAYTRAERALALARERRERGHEAHALRLLGEIAAHRAPPNVDEAAAQYRRALAMAEELGMRPLQAHCHLDLGKLYCDIDRGEQARAELSTAIEMYRAMAMTFWLPEVEAALVRVEGQ